MSCISISQALNLLTWRMPRSLYISSHMISLCLNGDCSSLSHHEALRVGTAKEYSYKCLKGSMFFVSRAFWVCVKCLKEYELRVVCYCKHASKRMEEAKKKPFQPYRDTKRLRNSKFSCAHSVDPGRFRMSVIACSVDYFSPIFVLKWVSTPNRRWHALYA